MPITKKHKKSRNNKSKRRNYKHKTNRKQTNGRRKNSFRGMARGSDSDNLVECSMCENAVSLADTLVPQKCLQKHGYRAHRICQKCWWDPVSGFAREGLNHACPGCKKHMPLTVVKGKSPNPQDIIEILDSDTE